MDWINVIAIIISPIIAVLITTWINSKNEQRKEKMEVFKQLMVARAIPKTYEYVKVMNSLDVIFADNSKVRKAWRNLYNEYKTHPADLNKVKNCQIKLIEEVAKDLGYKDKITWDEIIGNEYVPEWLAQLWEQERLNKEGQEVFVGMAKTISANLSKANEPQKNEQ